jgi:CBS-domain-containing membrane protein
MFMAVAPATSIVEAAAVMVKQNASGLPVVYEGNRLLGIVTEGDFPRRPEIGTQRRRSRWLLFFVGCAGADFVRGRGRRVGEVKTRNPLIGADIVLLFAGPDRAILLIFRNRRRFQWRLGSIATA